MFLYIKKTYSPKDAKSITIPKEDIKNLKRELSDARMELSLVINKLKSLGAENVVFIIEELKDLKKELLKNVASAPSFDIDTFNNLRKEKKRLIKKAEEEIDKFYPKLAE